MAEKLKSILRRISWSSLLKAAIFVFAWWLLPFWLFAIIALVLYYYPIAGAGTVSAPFWVLLLLSLIEAPNLLLAIVFGGVFYLILLIKDLLIIDRRTVYEILVLVLAYLMLRTFFEHLGGGGFGSWSLIWSLPIAAVLALMLGSFIKNFLPGTGDEISPETGKYLRASGWIAFMLIWELIIAGLFLPLNFLYQGASVFIVAAALMDLLAVYSFGELTRNKALISCMIVFAFLTIVFASARWVL